MAAQGSIPLDAVEGALLKLDVVDDDELVPEGLLPLSSVTGTVPGILEMVVSEFL